VHNSIVLAIFVPKGEVGENLTKLWQKKTVFDCFYVTFLHDVACRELLKSAYFHRVIQKITVVVFWDTV